MLLSSETPPSQHTRRRRRVPDHHAEQRSPAIGACLVRSHPRDILGDEPAQGDRTPVGGRVKRREAGLTAKAREELSGAKTCVLVVAVVPGL